MYTSSTYSSDLKVDYRVILMDICKERELDEGREEGIKREIEGGRMKEGRDVNRVRDRRRKLIDLNVYSLS